MNIQEQLRELRRLKQVKEETYKANERAKLEFVEAQTAILEYMEKEGLEGTKVDGINFVPAKTIYGGVTDRAKFVEWAEENEPSILEPKERKDQMNEMARRLADDGQPPPPGFDIRVTEYVSQRAA